MGAVVVPPLPEPNCLDPMAAFAEWYAFAEGSGVPLPEAAALATATPEGAPSARMILFKGIDERGLRFFTNFTSRKAREIEANPRAALCFHWATLERQVRFCGGVEKIGREASYEYFQSRPRASRIGAWASMQSAPCRDRAEIEANVARMEKGFRGGEVPLPHHWGGYRLVPSEIEFWLGRRDRLHDRVSFLREGPGPWVGTLLQP